LARLSRVGCQQRYRRNCCPNSVPCHCGFGLSTS
jgi:hypothetical protein